MNLVSNWFQRNFSDPQVVILGAILIFFVALIMFLGSALAPAIAGLIVAYLLDSMVLRLQSIGISRLVGVFLVFIGFMALSVFVLLVLGPMLSRQVSQFVSQIPQYLNQAQEMLAELPRRYPQWFSEQQSEQLMTQFSAEVTNVGQKLVTESLSLVPGLFSLLVFLILIPILVFFFLKDKHELLGWFRAFLPDDRQLADSVWQEVDRQIGNYIRGKAVEILIVGLVTYVVFSMLGLQYAVLLATLTGLSVLIPYIGAAAVTIPVALVAFFQFGWSWDFVWVVGAYGIIQALDGNVLVPLLFSEVVDLHPVAIILAVLIFGGIWGFWGVFFAIPLATVVNAVLRAWPRAQTLPGKEDSRSEAS